MKYKVTYTLRFVETEPIELGIYDTKEQVKEAITKFISENTNHLESLLFKETTLTLNAAAIGIRFNTQLIGTYKFTKISEDGIPYGEVLSYEGESITDVLIKSFFKCTFMSITDFVLIYRDTLCTLKSSELKTTDIRYIHDFVRNHPDGTTKTEEEIWKLLPEQMQKFLLFVGRKFFNEDMTIASLYWNDLQNKGYIVHWWVE